MTDTELQFTSGSTSSSTGQYVVLGEKDGCVFSVRPIIERVEVGSASMVLNGLRFRFESPKKEDESKDDRMERFRNAIEGVELPLTIKTGVHASMVAGTPVSFANEDAFLGSSMTALKNLFDEIYKRFGGEGELTAPEAVLDHAREIWRAEFEQRKEKASAADQGKYILAADFASDTIN